MSVPSNHTKRVQNACSRTGRKSTTDVEPLFRSKVIAERQSQWLGTVLLAPTISHTLFVTFAAVAVVAVLSLLFFAGFSRSEQVSGWLVPDYGLVRIVAPHPGVITRLHVRDGDIVLAGDALVTLSNELRSEAYGATQEEILRHLRNQRDSLNTERELLNELFVEDTNGLENRISALVSEQAHFAGEIEIQRRQVALARQSVERMRSVLDRGLVPPRQFESAESNRLEQSLKLRVLERQLTAAGRERLVLEAELKRLPLRNKTRIAEHDRDAAALEQKLLAAEAQRQFVVTATRAGTVTALRAAQGSSANTSTPLLNIVPLGSELQARLYVPSRAAGFIQLGQEVRLRYEAFPYQKFGHHQGTVRSISRSAVSPKELGSQLEGLTSLLKGDEPVYIVTVELANQSVIAYGNSLSLQPGMQLQANVHIETRRLIEWVFDPLFTLTGR